jgi:hypothetical protein
MALCLSHQGYSEGVPPAGWLLLELWRLWKNLGQRVPFLYTAAFHTPAVAPSAAWRVTSEAQAWLEAPATSLGLLENVSRVCFPLEPEMIQGQNYNFHFCISTVWYTEGT